MTSIKIGAVRIPIFTLLAAVPAAVRAAQAVACDDHDADSPGGTKVTASEVAEALASFCQSLAESALPSIMQANGHR